MQLQPGLLVSYSASPDATYQVVNVDDFSVPADQVRPIASELS